MYRCGSLEDNEIDKDITAMVPESRTAEDDGYTFA